MYDFLIEYCAASDAVRNNAGLTPLVLAAHLGKLAMFQVGQACAEPPPARRVGAAVPAFEAESPARAAAGGPAAAV